MKKFLIVIVTLALALAALPLTTVSAGADPTSANIFCTGSEFWFEYTNPGNDPITLYVDGKWFGTRNASNETGPLGLEPGTYHFKATITYSSSPLFVISNPVKTLFDKDVTCGGQTESGWSPEWCYTTDSCHGFVDLEAPLQQGVLYETSNGDGTYVWTYWTPDAYTPLGWTWTDPATGTTYPELAPESPLTIEQFAQMVQQYSKYVAPASVVPHAYEG